MSVDKYGTWSKNTIADNHYIRLVTHRPDDNRSFFEASQRHFTEKRQILKTAVIDMTDEDLRELRDYLNSLKL